MIKGLGEHITHTLKQVNVGPAKSNTETLSQKVVPTQKLFQTSKTSHANKYEQLDLRVESEEFFLRPAAYCLDIVHIGGIFVRASKSSFYVERRQPVNILAHLSNRLPIKTGLGLDHV